MATMTSFQQFMVLWIDLRGGAARVAGAWVCEDDVRQSADLAEQLYWLVA